MKKNFFKSLCVALALLVHLPGGAEDIDVFMGVTPSAADLPNVLIVLDNTANWNGAFVNEKAALVSVVNGLEVDKFNVGLMMFTETGSGNGGNDGGYVRAAIRPLNATNKPLYSALVNSLDVGGDKSNGGKIGKSMEEAYLYFSGGTVHAGNKAKADYTGNASGTTASNAVYARTGNALASSNATRYNNPVAANSCAKNFIIYISNGAAQDNSSDTGQAQTALGDAAEAAARAEATAAGKTTAQIDAAGAAARAAAIAQIGLNPSGSATNVADEWVRYMKNSPLGVTTYTIDINKVTTGQGPGWTALLKSMAKQSTGRYFDVASGNAGAEIRAALQDIFSQIQSVNSVFASVSLPVSANTQGTYLNQIFVGMFRPDQNAYPRWNGNLKQYKMGFVGTDLQLLDANGANALNSNTGFVSECARSFWTPGTLDTEWISQPSGDCITVANSKSSNYPDGNVVEKGAQAYQLRQSATRNVKTCSTAACPLPLVAFNNTTVSQTQLGAADTTERDLLINWTIGKDNQDEDGDGSTTDNRLSLHGDVVHSRPVAVNFGTSQAPNVVVFYGANDGLLRAINGNQTSAIGSIPAGGELWSFVPTEFFGSLKRLRDNNTRITFPGSATGTPAAAGKPYGIDGPITAFKSETNSNVFLYATMRRGGRAVYAFNVSNSITDPTNPTLKWKIGCPNKINDTGCTTGMTGMGQSWSAVKSFTTPGYGGSGGAPGDTPLLIMGGGYDNCEDYDALSPGGANHNCTSSSKGHYVYVLNADTGAVVKTFDTGDTRGIIADISLAYDVNRRAVYGYTADLGGNVYRIAFGNGAAHSDNSSTWTMTKIASLGCDTTASCTANRKFMFAPSVAKIDSGYVVMLGSGDREKPLSYFQSAAAVTNLFFMFPDKPMVAASSWPGTADCGTALICKNSLYGITTSATPTPTELAAKKGWYLGMRSQEQVVTSALTMSGVVSFSTHTPPAAVTGVCGPNLGKARAYGVHYTNAKPARGTDRSREIATGGLSPSPVGGIVDGKPFCIGCPSSGGILDPEEPLPSSTGTPPKGRLYWYLQK